MTSLRALECLVTIVEQGSLTQAATVADRAVLAGRRVAAGAGRHGPR